MSDYNILSVFTPDGKVPGTGLLQVVRISEKEMGPLPQAVINQIIPYLPGLFGDYPNTYNDIGPSGLFLAIFTILAFANLYIFVRNWTRGQRVYAWLAMTFYAFAMMIGFAMRLRWAHNVLAVKLGIAQVVFLQLPTLLLNSMTFLYGERIFAWRHPQTAHCRWFRGLILFVYVIVVGIIVMAIVSQSVPYIYFLDAHHLHMCHQVTQAASILNILYGLTGLTMIQLAFLFKPGTIDHRIFRYPRMIAYDSLPNMAQATWIQKTSLFYFPAKNSQIKAPKNSYRVIPTRQAPHGGIATLLNGENAQCPNVYTSAGISVLASLMLVFALCFRCASVFTVKNRGGSLPVSDAYSPPATPLNAWVFHNYVFYIWYGAFEVLVNVLFLVTRCDLRFYIPPWSNTVIESSGPVESKPYEQNEKTDNASQHS